MKPNDLKKQRLALELSQEALGEALDVKRLTIIRYEMGQTKIPKVVEMAMELLMLKHKGKV